MRDEVFSSMSGLKATHAYPNGAASGASSYSHYSAASAAAASGSSGAGSSMKRHMKVSDSSDSAVVDAL